MLSNDSARLFVALPLPASVRQQLARISMEGRPLAGRTVRWVPVQNLHITLRFLGEIPRATRDDLTEACQEVAARSPALQLSVKGTGAFPHWRQPSVLWAGVEGNVVGIRKLHDDLQAQLERVGLPAESRRFTPHVTLGRCRRGCSTGLPEFMRSVGKALDTPFTAEQLVLFRSDLQPEGPIYTPLWSAVLAGQLGY